MPEDSKEGLAEEQVEQPEGSVDRKVREELEASVNAEDEGVESPADEQPQTEDSEVSSDYAVDPSMLSKDVGERDKQWQRAFTKKTQEYSQEAKDLREQLEQQKNQVSQLQSVLQIPEVYKKAQEVYGQTPQTEDLSKRIDPDSMKLLDEYLQDRLGKYMQPYNQHLTTMAEERKADRDANEIEQIEGALGRELTDSEVSAMDDVIKEHPNLGMIKAYRVIAYDDLYNDASKVRAAKQKSNKVMHKPGYSASVNGPVGDKDKDLNEIFQEELRRR